MLVPNRNYQSPSYRYGFQGQEKDDEIKGNGNSLNYRFRMHDPRVGRFFAEDPLRSQYPHNSPYAFSENRVIDGIELEGLETRYYSIQFDNNGQSKLKLEHTVHGTLFDAGYNNIISYKGTQYNQGGGFEVVDKFFAKIMPSTKDFNGQWNRIKKFEGKSENYLDTVFGAQETWENEKTRRDNELEERIVGTLENAFMAGVGGKKGGVLETKIKANTKVKIGEAKTPVNSSNKSILHKNNNDYVGYQAVYQIKINGKLHKYGKADMTTLSTTGNPTRLQSQINKLRIDNPNSTITGKVLYKNKNISTRDIKKIETQLIQRYTNKKGSLPDGNQNHPGVVIPNKE